MADKPVSMLGVSVRAGVLNVLCDVRDGLGLAAMYISHDLSLVRYVFERCAIEAPAARQTEPDRPLRVLPPYDERSRGDIAPNSRAFSGS